MSAEYIRQQHVDNYLVYLENQIKQLTKIIMEHMQTHLEFDKRETIQKKT